MAKHIMQFRYYNDEQDNNNQPEDLKAKDLEKGENNIFSKYTPITQLGIQALPGTRFTLNRNIEGPVIIGSTGIYELDLEGISKINSLDFDPKSLKLIADNPNAFLIIDVIYES